MSAQVIGAKVRWMIAAIVAAVMVLAFLLLVRVPPQVVVLTHASPKPSVQIVEPVVADAVLKEELELRDLRPLFLPTRRNATFPEPRLEAGRAFLKDEEPKPGQVGADLNLEEDLAPLVTLNGKPLRVSPKKDGEAQPKAGPVDLLIEDGPGRALGFGRGMVAAVPLESRGGFVEVVDIATGRRMLRETLPAEARPPGEKPWEPLEFEAAVNAVGLAMPLVVTASSRVEEVDAHYRNYLARKYRIGERLRPGFYRVIVAP